MLPWPVRARAIRSRAGSRDRRVCRGGPSDTIARLLSDHVGRQFGQQLVVENVAGAGGTTGTDRAANATPDGYTILTHHSGLTAAPALYRT